MNSPETERLFSYGTLQTLSVQLSAFGRKLTGSPDTLAGYRLRMIQIMDQEFVATSGAEYHRTLATKSHTAISYNYHLELASRLSSEADRIQGIVIFEEESLWQDPPT